jgi:hypothetical protein
MLHTIQEAVALTGKSRRTIYNHCDSGRVSYSVGPDDRRYIETSELIRVYGALHTVAQPAAAEVAQVCTPIAHQDAPLTEATARRLVAAMERLIEIEEAKLLRIEHKPATKPQSFADLLAGLD